MIIAYIKLDSTDDCERENQNSASNFKCTFPIRVNGKHIPQRINNYDLNISNIHLSNDDSNQFDRVLRQQRINGQGN